jgi:hypothetical protein
MVGMEIFGQRKGILEVEVMVLLVRFKMNLITIPRQLEFPLVCFVVCGCLRLLQ